MGDQLGVSLDHVRGKVVLVEITLRILVLQHVRPLGVRRQRLGDLGATLAVGHCLAGQGEQRLHIEGDADDRQEPDDGKHDGLLADGLVVAVSAERDAPLARARARALVHHEDAVQGHGGHHGKEHEQDDADGDRAGTRQIRLGDAVQIIRIIDLEHAAVQRLAIELGMEEVAVLKLRDVKPRLKGVGTHHGGIGAVRDQVIPCRNRHDVAVAPDGHILEHAGGRAGAIDKLAQLGGAVLDDHHGIVVERARVIALQPSPLGQLDLHRIGGLARIKRRP